MGVANGSQEIRAEKPELYSMFGHKTGKREDGAGQGRDYVIMIAETGASILHDFTREIRLGRHVVEPPIDEKDFDALV